MMSICGGLVPQVHTRSQINTQAVRRALCDLQAHEVGCPWYRLLQVAARLHLALCVVESACTKAAYVWQHCSWCVSAICTVVVDENGAAEMKSEMGNQPTKDPNSKTIAVIIPALVRFCSLARNQRSNTFPRCDDHTERSTAHTAHSE